MCTICLDFRDLGLFVFPCKMWLNSLALMALCLLLGAILKTSTLSVLLCLEALVVVGVLILVQHSELMFGVCLVSIGACESAVGLSCLVSLVRAQGDQFFTL